MSDKFGEGRDPYLYPGLDIMRNRLNIHQQQRLEQAAYEMTALRAATIELGPLVRGLPHLRTIHRQLYQDIFDWAGQLREVIFIRAIRRSATLLISKKRAMP
ncbi:cell filamentation protein Fic [Escherichia coli]|nr:cell filamentation protein Fic [Escherichia coli]